MVSHGCNRHLIILSGRNQVATLPCLVQHRELGTRERSGESDLFARVGASTDIKLLLKTKLSLLNMLQSTGLQLPVPKQIGGFKNLKIAFMWQDTTWQLMH